MSFKQDSIDFFSGKKSAHMGTHQYAAHEGSRQGKSMSGSKLWTDIEKAELSANKDNIFNKEEILIKKIAAQLGAYIPAGTPLLEMGPGTLNAFKNKTLPLLNALKSREYICVDKSKIFLNNLTKESNFRDIPYTPIVDDFFQENKLKYTHHKTTILCMNGSTIGNIPAPLSTSQPRVQLVASLRSLAQRINEGWLLLSFDSDQNENNIIEYYNKHIDFHLNFFDRMVSELPMSNSFDPNAFSYKAIWVKKASLLAHMAVLKQDLEFTIDKKLFSLKKGQTFHIKNSYKFLPLFFTSCCKEAELEVTKTWNTSSQKSTWLLKKKTSTSMYTSYIQNTVHK